jgi:hypothetical protein
MIARKSNQPEAIREAAQVAYQMGADVVVAALAGIQSKENRLNAKAIDAEFRVIEDPKGLLTDGKDGR